MKSIQGNKIRLLDSIIIFTKKHRVGDQQMNRLDFSTIDENEKLLLEGEFNKEEVVQPLKV